MVEENGINVVKYQATNYFFRQIVRDRLFSLRAVLPPFSSSLIARMLVPPCVCSDTAP